MPFTIAALGVDAPLAKRSEGIFRFVCTRCHEMQAVVNPRNNLAHCFHCHQNINIDLLMTLGYDFRTAVAILQNLLERHESRLPNKETKNLLKSTVRDDPLRRDYLLQNSP